MNSVNKLNFLGLDLVNSDLDTVFNEVIFYLNSESNIVKYLFTPNPEMFVESKKNSKFFYVLKSADWLLPDGIGIKIWAKFFGLNLESRLTGVDFFELYLNSPNVEFKTFLLGGANSSAKFISDKYKKICGYYDGKVDSLNNYNIISSINDSNAEVVFVALGAPKQELWIDEYSLKCPKVKLWIGVGGAFDFVAGIQTRSPRIFRILGLEWLYRLYKEPKRLHRILNAVFVFSWICFKSLVLKTFNQEKF